MSKPVAARTIWDVQIQNVCGIVAARLGDEVEIFGSGNFGQASLDPPRVVVNPNRLYRIEEVIRESGRFSISVLTSRHRDLMRRLMRIRRRQPDKARVLGIELGERHGIPHFAGARWVVWCEVESTLETGDHRVFVGRVIESWHNDELREESPLLYREAIADLSPAARAADRVRRVLVATGALERAKRLLGRAAAPGAEGTIRHNTYETGGQTEAEIGEIVKWGLIDNGKVIEVPPAAVELSGNTGVCVAGIGSWGSFHCQLVRQALPGARLYVCGRDEQRTATFARRVRADGWYSSLEAAVKDDRVEAVTAALPHDLHRWAAEVAVAAGKPLLLEKPVALTLEDADAIGRLAAQGMVMVAENMHFRADLAEAVRRIERGDVGEPLLIQLNGGGVLRPSGWKRESARMGGGILMDMGVHYVRVLRLLAGEPDRVTAISPMQVNTRMQGEDSVQAVYGSRYGWRASMWLTWSSPRGMLPDVTVFGESGTLHLYPGKAYLDYYPAAPPAVVELIGMVRPYALQRKLLRETMLRERVAVDGDPTGYVAEFREFLAAVADQRAPRSTVAEARRDLEVVLKSYQALATGRQIAIDPV